MLYHRESSVLDFLIFLNKTIILVALIIFKKKMLKSVLFLYVYVRFYLLIYRILSLTYLRARNFMFAKDFYKIKLLVYRRIILHSRFNDLSNPSNEQVPSKKPGDKIFISLRTVV